MCTQMYIYIYTYVRNHKAYLTLCSSTFHFSTALHTHTAHSELDSFCAASAVLKSQHDHITRHNVTLRAFRIFRQQKATQEESKESTLSVSA